ncbi:hypothetical protein QAD02_012017 [Eretmocerus hayati]|uniref:Uncharacterized protein n=1 Tax=Eretmocerus hayati TaxID=131215 RepID=A0ACC2NZK0_9HYME|nr:hypothetical protein QAD02_012017 [Eretmocerus hayati]
MADDPIEENLKKSFLNVCQSLQFSKPTKSDAEAVDIERRCLFTKYMICQQNPNQSVASSLLQNEIEKYSNFVDSREGLNNYWKQFNSLNITTDNDPLEWQSNLNDPEIALQFIETLPCASDKLEDCKNEQYSDRDVEKMMELWKNADSSPRPRKNPRHEASMPMKKEVRIEHVKEIKPLQPTVTGNTFGEKKIHIVNARPPRIESSHLKQTFNYEKPNVKPAPMNSRFQPRPPEKVQEEPDAKKFGGFKTARAELGIQQAKNNRQPMSNNRPQIASNRQQPVKKSLGGRALNSPFVCPFKDEQPNEQPTEPEEPPDERLKGIEPKMIELIKNEIMDCGNPITWDDIAGLENAKRVIKEIVVFPMLRPDIFTGLRRPPKGILLFGPPGTGKTLIGKCIASQSKSTFFSISASSLTSKWIGEGEKMVRALFAVARVEQPSVVFIDEIDSLLCQRSETEHESSRRMKTEFLVQLDGAQTGDEDRILVIGATNRPYELDEAARRRLVKRLYVPLPELEARAQIVRNLLKSERHDLEENDVYEIARLADGYSGADMTNLCKEASMGPIRSIPFDQLEGISKNDVRRVTFNDFKEALNAMRPSVSQKDLAVYLEWDKTYGTASQAR